MAAFAIAGTLAGPGSATAEPAALPPTHGKGVAIHVASSGSIDTFAGADRTGGFDLPFHQGHLMTSADVDGDGTDELIFAGDTPNRFYVYEADGSSYEVVETQLNGGPYRVAAGDADGNGTEEVFVSGPSGVDTFTAAGQHVGHIGLPLKPESLLEAGDTDGDGRAEILVAGDVVGRFYVWQADGSGYRVVDTGGLAGPYQLAAGDADGNGTDDVFMTKPGGVDAYTGTGQPIEHIGLPMLPGDLMDVGDTDGDGTAEVLLSDGTPGRFYIYEADLDYQVVLTGQDDGPYAITAGSKGSRDLDSDAIPDRIEVSGITDANGTVLLRPSNPCRETINVEIDYMLEPGGGSAPEAEALERVRAAFDQAPRRAVSVCPFPGNSTASGVELHAEVDDAIAFSAAPVGTPAEFDAIKAAHTEARLSPYVHYNPWVDAVVVEGKPYGGYCCYGTFGHDFLVAAGGGTTRQAATFMHELGHALGLGHGGGDGVNYKPNYLSIMNYWFSNNGIRNLDTGKAVIDYSRRALPTLYELDLAEPLGVQATGSPLRTRWHTLGGGTESGRASGPLDWTGNNFDGVGADDDDQHVAVDLNGDEKLDGLAGFDDWAHLHYGGWPAGGGGLLDEELTLDEAAANEQSLDGELTPDRTLTFGTPPPGHRAAIIGVAQDDRRVYLTRYTHQIAEPQQATQPGELIVLDKADLRVLARVPVGWDPRSVAVNPVTKRIYVVNYGKQSYSVSVIDGTTFATLATIPSGQAPIDVAVNSRTNRIYVSTPYQERIQVIDGRTNTLLDPIVVGPGPQGLAVDERTNRIYVALTNRSYEPHVNALGVITDDGQTVTVHPKITIPGFQPIDVAVDGKHGRVYVANLGGGGFQPKLTIVDSGTSSVIAEVGIVRAVRGVAVNPDAREVLVSTDDGVFAVDDMRLRVTRFMPAGYGPMGISTGTGEERTLYVGNLDGELRRLSYSSGTPS